MYSFKISAILLHCIYKILKLFHISNLFTCEIMYLTFEITWFKNQCNGIWYGIKITVTFFVKSYRKIAIQYCVTMCSRRMSLDVEVLSLAENTLVFSESGHYTTSINLPFVSDFNHGARFKTNLFIFF